MDATTLWSGCMSVTKAFKDTNMAIASSSIVVTKSDMSFWIQF